MKPKLLLVRYFDKAILVALVGFVIYALATSFKVPEEATPGFAQSMKSSVSQITQKMERGLDQTPTIPAIIPQIEKLKGELHNPKPPTDLRKWVFYPAEPIPYPVIYVVKGKKYETSVDAALTNRIRGDEAVNDAFDADPRTNKTVLVFEGKNLTSKPVSLMYKDSDGEEHLFRVLVTDAPLKVLPLPVADVKIWFYKGEVCITAELRQPEDRKRIGAGGMVIEDDGLKRVARSVAYRIYRKLKGAPDETYKRVTPSDAMPVNVIEHARWVRGHKKLEVVEAGAAAPAADDNLLRPMGAAPGAGDRRVPGASGVQPSNLITKKYCHFADSAMDFGEEFDYKIVAVAAKDEAKPDEEPAESEPVVVDIEVPSDIELYLTRVRRGEARMQVLKRDFRNGLVYEFGLAKIVAGSAINGVGIRGTSYQDMDGQGYIRKESGRFNLTTGYVVVDLIEEAPRFSPRMRYDRKFIERPVRGADGEYVIIREMVRTLDYVADNRPEPLMLYLDNKGQLKAKYRSPAYVFEAFVPKNEVAPDRGRPDPDEPPELPGG